MNTIILIAVVVVSLFVGFVAHKYFSKKSAKKMMDDMKATTKAQAVQQESVEKVRGQKLLEEKSALEEKFKEERLSLEEKFKEQKKLHLDDTIRYHPQKMASLEDLVVLYKNYKELDSESLATIGAFKNAARAGLTRIYKSIRLQDDSVNVFEALSNIMEEGYQLAKQKKEEMPILLDIFRDTNEEEQELILQIFKAEAQRLGAEGDGNQINAFLGKIRGRWAIDTNPYPALLVEILMLHERLKALPIKTKVA